MAIRGMCAALILTLAAGAAAAQAGDETDKLTARAKSQLECAAYYGIMTKAYPENWQTVHRERANDAFVRLHSAGRQNMIRAGFSAEDADKLVYAQVDMLAALAERDGSGPRLVTIFKACEKLYSDTLARD